MSHAKAVITLTLLLLLTLTTQAQTTPAVHPVYIANLLTTTLTTDEMIETCRYYHLTETPTDPGHLAFTDKEGNILRFTDTRNSGDKRTAKTIELQVQESGKMIDHLLKNTGYTKQKDRYEKGSPYAASKTVCTLSSRGKYKILIFSKIKTSSPQKLYHSNPIHEIPSNHPASEIP